MRAYSTRGKGVRAALGSSQMPCDTRVEYGTGRTGGRRMLPAITSLREAIDGGKPCSA